MSVLQIQRFREHVAKQHADAAQTAGDEKSSRSAAEVMWPNHGSLSSMLGYSEVPRCDL